MRKRKTEYFNPEIPHSNGNSSKINFALLAHVYHMLRLGQLTAFFCATILLIGLQVAQENSANTTLFFSWYAFYACIFVLRMLLQNLYNRSYEHNFIVWKTLFAVGAFFGGLCWGLAGSVLLAQTNHEQQTLLILVIAGITAGATPLLSADRTAAISFISAALLPPITTLFILNNTQTAYSFFAIAAVGYYLYLVLLCNRLHNIIKNAIALKFENDILIESISQTKNQLEVINKKLVHAATHDPLTNLANRSLFEFSLLKAVQNAKANSQLVALFYIDLDNFKEINDTYGHHVGDQLLIKLIDRIRKNTRKCDTVSRLGGDELTVILEGITDIEIVRNTADRLCDVLSTPTTIQGNEIVATASIGISIYPNDGDDVETLLTKADKAMYYVKAHGRNNFRFSDYESEHAVLFTDGEKAKR